MSAPASRAAIVVLCLLYVGLVGTRVARDHYLLAGEAALVRGDSPAAEAAFRMGGVLDPLNSSGLVGQADAAFQEAENIHLGTPEHVVALERAVQFYRDALHRQPADPYAWAQLGRAYASLAVGKRATRVIDISQLEPSRTLREAEDDLALAALRHAVEMEPHNYDYIDFLAEVSWVQGRADALDWFRRGTYVLPRMQDHPYLERPDLEEEIVEAAIQGARDAVGSGNVVEDTRILAELALFHAWRGDREAALVANAEAIEMGHPSPGWLWTRQGIWFEALGRRSEAVIALERALELDPTRAAAHFALGRLALEEGEVDRAVGHLASARDLSPRTLRFQMELARVLDGADRLEPAAREYQRAVHLPGGEFPATTALVDLYRRHGIYDRAIVFARRLVELNPGEPLFQQQLEELTARLQF